MRILVLLTLSILCCSCVSESSDQTEEKQNLPADIIELENDEADSLSENLTETNSYKAESQYNDSLGWGYVILNNDQPYIRQPHIPAVAGMKGFKTEQDAIKTAEYVIYKLEKNIFPPSITIEELDSLEIAY